MPNCIRPAVAEIKADPARCADGQLVNQAFGDKGFDPQALSLLARANVLGPLTCGLVLRDASLAYGRAINQMHVGGSYVPTYFGSQEENAIVDASIVESPYKGSRERAAARRLGIAAVFGYQGPALREQLNAVPTVVIGGGPAGIMQARALELAGFNTGLMTILDARGTVGGVWSQPNVRDGVIGNPFPIEFAGVTLSRGPKPGTEIRDFIVALTRQDSFDRPLPPLIHGKAVRVVPGDLCHKVTYRRGNTERTIASPLVFNAIGTGQPLPPDNPAYMTTNTEERAGQRWQRILSPEEAEKLRGKQVVFVGLCNSTGTMLRQFAALNRQGFDIGYTILTHMPEEAVRNPDKDVAVDGQTFRVYRDLAEDDLTAYEGDTENGIVYQQALREGRIVTDVTHWDRSDGKIIYIRRGQTMTAKCDYFMTLIGYAQRADVLRNMGLLVTDDYLGAVCFDYDGEVQARPGTPGRQRLYPGYYVQGTLRRTPENPNAPVMSSIVHSIFDTTFGAVVRAVEYLRTTGG